MNILPHKSWHVYNKENQAKVAEDEAKHEAELEEKKQAQIDNDRLYRLQLLRNKAHGDSEPLVEYQNDQFAAADVIEKNDVQQSTPQSYEHINLFEEKKDKKIPEVKHVAKIDKQREYAKSDKTNLFNKKNLSQPWYTRSSKELSNYDADKQSKHLPIVSSATLDDPLTMIRKYTNSGQHDDKNEITKTKKKRKHKSSKHDKEHKADKHREPLNYDNEYINEKYRRSSDRDKEHKAKKSHRSSDSDKRHRSEKYSRSSDRGKEHRTERSYRVSSETTDNRNEMLYSSSKSYKSYKSFTGSKDDRPRDTEKYSKY
ncbi:hypothetical protein CONCODRAFT_77191 [Conidiobolus coronatus NRRL 28638]|uniref:CBF1-interacting co-repressor CIR N-terminal domain-containing protein n=1 Tax=Conidiobolus coronatus (strain ATCC 28846 / CBS 209.66 / NRRL 28638) TaxID=796925 RepID=A0A137PFR7_CONC2|nr:hypothetical protein CONCODRAFT_77191 [Conidiobolus coronatus NRRL 28638]|eukprot:KXN73815.1 hypothetical protein CONCODRAFT_77191 [Conidiobolus coronatus NRRL 28638]